MVAINWIMGDSILGLNGKNFCFPITCDVNLTLLGYNIEKYCPLIGTVISIWPPFAI